jgi:hypothetical protein
VHSFPTLHAGTNSWSTTAPFVTRNAGLATEDLAGSLTRPDGRADAAATELGTFSSLDSEARLALSPVGPSIDLPPPAAQSGGQYAALGDRGDGESGFRWGAIIPWGALSATPSRPKRWEFSDD